MSTNKKYNKYVDLKVNGRLFPSWVLANFKKYKLEEILRISGQDPCNVKTTTGEIVKKLRKYQEFVSIYLDYESPYKNILLYHGLGSGKTASAINIYNALYNYTPGWNVFILIKASLRGDWMNNIKEWLKKDDYEHRFRNIKFINYDSPFADRQFIEITKNVDSSKKSLYLIDEVHNFINNVYSNISSGKGRRAQIIYDYIIQDKRDNLDTRVVLLSGTPAINQPFELSLLFNLLRPGIFPKSESEFNRLFVSSGMYQTINSNTKNMFQRRILGLVSYYLGATSDVYAEQSTHYIDVKMSKYQEDIYKFFEEIEAKAAAKSVSSGAMGFMSYTRQACNFVFPSISQKVTGENRPRPGKFRLSEKEAIRLSESRDIAQEKMTAVQGYMNAIKYFIDEFKRHLNSKNEEDKVANYTIIDDVKVYLNKYKGDYSEFHEKEKKKSKLYDVMYMCSPKLTYIIFNIMKSPGPTVVYSNYVLVEGLEMLKVYLHHFNFYSYMNKFQLEKDKIGYVEFHGGIKNLDDRFKGRDAYNMKENIKGDLIKIILISPAGAEGLSLSNVRQIHIMEPYWNEVRIIQMIGRGIRQCSHKDLPIEERHVDVFRYKAIKNSPTSKQTTDQFIEDKARGKDGLIQSFLDSVKEAAVDCKLFQSHNLTSQNYKCFQFEEPSLFNPHVGPAYKEQLEDDVKMNNGLNSGNAVTIKVKVMKIKAVKVLSKPDAEKEEYSKPENYWFYQKTGTIYDYDLHFPVGKILYDESGIPDKLDKDTYKIGYLVPIPMIKN